MHVRELPSLSRSADGREPSPMAAAMNRRTDQIIDEMLSDVREISPPARVKVGRVKHYSAEERADILAQLSPSINPTVLARTHGVSVRRILRWAQKAGIQIIDGRTRGRQWKA